MKNLLVNGQEAPIGIDPRLAVFSFSADCEAVYEVELYEEKGKSPVTACVVGRDTCKGFRFFKQLSPETVYRWTVGDGIRQATAYFETGLAHTCAPRMQTADEKGLLYQKYFAIPTDVTAARFYVFGDESLRVLLNGEAVTRFYRSLPPDCGQMPAYRTADVEALLWKGDENRICLYTAPQGVAFCAMELRFFRESGGWSGYCF